MATTPSTTPPVVTGVTPHLSPSDANAAAALYQRAFGAEVLQRVPADDGKRLLHCHLRINGGNVFLADPFPEHGHPAKTPQGFTLHLHVDDADAWWKRAVDAGLEVTMQLHDAFWGDRYGELKDPFGYSWAIGAPKK